jgi:hypothetical protein
MLQDIQILQSFARYGLLQDSGSRSPWICGADLAIAISNTKRPEKPCFQAVYSVLGAQRPSAERRASAQ